MHGFGTGRFRCYRYSDCGRFLIYDNLTSLDFNLSVEQVEALDEASSIEPAQRNKTMTGALAYGGTRDSVIA